MALPSATIRVKARPSQAGNLLTIADVAEALAQADFPEGALVDRATFRSLALLVPDSFIQRDVTDGIFIDIVRCRIYPEPLP